MSQSANPQVLAFTSCIPHEFARRHLVLGRGVSASPDTRPAERLAVSDRTSPAAVHNVSVRLGRSVTTELAPADTLAAEIDDVYAKRTSHIRAADARDQEGDALVELAAPTSDEHDLRAVVASVEADLLTTDGKGPVIRLVDLLLFEALQKSASDVHIQPVANRVLVRYRLDGVLVTVRTMPLAMLPAIVSRVKVMARLDVAEQRAPQDGRATVTIGSGSDRRIDLRISTLPTTYGERVVLRILDTSKSPHLLSFGALGIPEPLQRQYLRQVSRTSGVVLVTGPTGSGKTTTLYTTLAWITQQSAGARPSPQAAQATDCPLNIMTIEDPVEYDLATAGLAISQTQLNSKKHVTFAAGLRHILRQDPDVIMVGEIRDEETARVAVQASLTGHLVLSTLHTNDAAGAIARLLDLGVEPFLVSSSLAAVLAQRLVRRIHVVCQGSGCESCLGTGFKGRTGVFELLVLDEALRTLISQRSGASVIKQQAVRQGLVTLRDAGERLARDGTTRLEEITRVIEGLE